MRGNETSRPPIVLRFCFGLKDNGGLEPIEKEVKNNGLFD